MAGASEKHLFKVEMTCEGCAKAITNVLNKHKGAGITNFDVNLKEQTVMVESTMKKEAIMEILKKTGKNTTYIEQK